MREGTWIDPKGKVHDLGGKMSHEAFARAWLTKHKQKPSIAAKTARRLSLYSRTDAGPSFFELLRRGWVRQRGCDFTVWKFDGPTSMSMAIGAHHLWCPQIIAEACSERGCKDVRRWSTVDSMVEDFSGLRRKRRSHT